MFIAYDKVNDQAFGPFTDEAKAKKWAYGLDAALEDTGRGPIHDQAWTWSFVEVMHVDEDDASYREWMGEPDFHATFGPGSLESINLEKWKSGQARVSGIFMVYCGNGSEHAFEVESGIIPADAFAEYEAEAAAVDPETDRELMVKNIIDEILNEEWSDPCEVLTLEED